MAYKRTDLNPPPLPPFPLSTWSEDQCLANGHRISCILNRSLARSLVRSFRTRDGRDPRSIFLTPSRCRDLLCRDVSSEYVVVVRHGVEKRRKKKKKD